MRRSRIGWDLLEASGEQRDIWALRDITREAVTLARRLSADNETLRNQLALVRAELERYGYEADS